MTLDDSFMILARNDIDQPTNAVSSTMPLVDQNCACPDTDSYLALQTTPYTDATPLVQSWLHTEQLGVDTYLAFNPVGQSGPVMLNTAAWQLLQRFNQPQTVTETTHSLVEQNAIRRLLACDLLQPVGAQYQLMRGQEQTLVAWLHTTNACNLRCTYCYINKSEEAMEETTGYAAVDAIFRAAQQHGYPNIKIKYAGGESTLNFGLVMKLHGYAQQKAKATGIALRSVILSNGIALTAAMLQFIRDAKITLSLSLDGLGETHDDQRVFSNGRGSAAIVARSIVRALQHGVSPHLSITVTSRNADAVAEAVQFALEHNLFFNLNFYRDTDVAQGQAALRAEDEQLIAAIQHAFAVIEQNLPKHSLLASLVDRANFAAVHETACGAGHSYMVVDQRGQVARCQMEIEQAVSNVFAADPLAEIRLYDKGFQYTSVEEKSGCRECSWRYWCAGGCPALTYQVTGRNDVKSPYCTVYQAIYPQLLRLEGKRLLHYATN